MKWSEDVRARVRELHGSGRTWAAIEELTGVPRQTAWSMVNYYGRPRPARRRAPEPPVEPPVVIGPPVSRVEPGPTALVNVLDMAALWTRMAADKMLTEEKVLVADRKALARLEDAWVVLQNRRRIQDGSEED